MREGGRESKLDTLNMVSQYDIEILQLHEIANDHYTGHAVFTCRSCDIHMQVM